MYDLESDKSDVSLNFWMLRVYYKSGRFSVAVGTSLLYVQFCVLYTCWCKKVEGKTWPVRAHLNRQWIGLRQKWVKLRTKTHDWRDISNIVHMTTSWKSATTVIQIYMVLFLSLYVYHFEAWVVKITINLMRGKFYKLHIWSWLYHERMVFLIGSMNMSK